MLGILTDVVDATEHLLGARARLASEAGRRRDQVNDRYFLFSAGVGLDASVVQQVDAHPRLKARLGEWYYTWIGVQTSTAAISCIRRGSRPSSEASA